MTLFLFLKQITDMLFQFRVLDVLMVLMAVVALGYQIMLVRPSIKHNVAVSDVAVLSLAVILTGSFVQTPGTTYITYVKVMSAVLLYFVGRIYYERLMECSGALVASSYVVVYANLIHRIICFGKDFFRVTNAQGDIYYNDTDLAYGLLISLIFIAFYGRNSIIKAITLFFVIPVLILNSDAGVQKFLFIAVYVLIIIYCLEKLGVPRKISNGIMLTAIVGLLFLITMMLLPVFTGENNFVSAVFGDGWVSFSQMEYRYAAWKDIWGMVCGATLLQKLFGTSLNVVEGNQYMAILYSVGIVGCILVVVFIVDLLRRLFVIEDRKTYYVMILLSILFLGSSIVMNCMEYTQCSWFMLMYGGMVISACKKKEE